MADHADAEGPLGAPASGSGARTDNTTPRSYTRLVVERDGPVGWLVFDRPARGNAMDAAMLAELEYAWRELDADPAVRVIVNTGNGKAFQTGLDVAQLARDPAALREQSRRTKRSELRLTAHHNRVAKPVIAAVNGVCAGGGLHFVADADIVIASAHAVFLDPHVTVGQVSASEAITLGARMAFEPVMRMVLTGRHERLTAERAYRLGMVSQLVTPPDTLRDAAHELASTIARNPPELLAATKRALWNALEHPGRTSPWHTPNSNT
ncbi:enoyl-CoA hydratase/isomerase family protein [Yinghuangia sp. YIM S10712]|uniref:enoyl-CoA hydratase/isomerase family protein n=1 Tax=Yinghuangia sp. YIM S10712 TaxID=3436930 RepID=UPI003F52B67F